MSARSRKPKAFILGLDTWSGDGGIQRHSRRLQQVLAELVGSGKMGQAEFLSIWDDATQRDQGSVRIRGVKALQSGSVTGKQRVLSFVRALPTFVSDFVMVRPSHFVVAHKVLLPFAVLGKLLFPRTRVVLVLYGVEVWKHLNKLETFSLSAVDEMVAISEFTVRNAAESNPRFSSIPVCVIPCAIDANTEGGDPKSPGGNYSLVTAARLSSRARDKHIEQVIRAMPLIRETYPDVKLRVIGDGDDRARLESIASACKVSENVEFLGYVSDEMKNQTLGSSAIFVLPSTREGFGIVYLEAWQHGLAVIAGNDGAAPEVVRDGVDGACVAPEPGAIAESVTALLADPALRARYSASGAERLATRFSHQTFATNWAEVFT